MQFERMLSVLLDTVDQQSHVALLLYADDRPIGVGRLCRFTSNAAAADLAAECLNGTCEVVIQVCRSSATGLADAA